MVWDDTCLPVPQSANLIQEVDSSFVWRSELSFSTVFAQQKQSLGKIDFLKSRVGMSFGWPALSILQSQSCMVQFPETWLVDFGSRSNKSLCVLMISNTRPQHGLYGESWYCVCRGVLGVSGAGCLSSQVWTFMSICLHNSTSREILWVKKIVLAYIAAMMETSLDRLMRKNCQTSWFYIIHSWDHLNSNLSSQCLPQVGDGRQVTFAVLGGSMLVCWGVQKSLPSMLRTNVVLKLKL